jgi:hypothetical protein
VEDEEDGVVPALPAQRDPLGEAAELDEAGLAHAGRRLEVEGPGIPALTRAAEERRSGGGAAEGEEG